MEQGKKWFTKSKIIDCPNCGAAVAESESIAIDDCEHTNVMLDVLGRKVEDMLREDRHAPDYYTALHEVSDFIEHLKKNTN